MKKKLIVSALSLSMLGTPFAANFAKASEISPVQENVNYITNQDEQFEYEGVTYTVKDNQNYRTVTAENSDGIQIFTTNKITNHITVTSDYLNEAERVEIEKQVNGIKVEIGTDDNEVTDEALPNLLKQSVIKNQFGKNTISTQSVVGSWVWSSWSNYKITVSGKFTVQTITAALLSYIPYVGPIAGGLAAVMLQYGIKTGYYRSRGASAADTDPNYLWSKRQVNLYKDSAHKTLLSSKTTDPMKVRMY
ncbi:hypothetical protein [Priestia koreensis]|uniref:Uncharacterized protein n=1 Tax=Priestia koreensis TaxID=284581 RepID=A0A0M0LAK3_9BACI|nr:hypothetical protein [Priestia koreensis]KOO48130.1 hypothetical protein AMD01_04795 [Priestia koreensis]